MTAGANALFHPLDAADFGEREAASLGGGTPSRILSAVDISTNERISSSSSARPDPGEGSTTALTRSDSKEVHAPSSTLRDRKRNAIPTAPVLLELLAAGRRQRVVLRVAVVLARTPLGFQLAVLLEPVQRREQRAGIDPEVVVAERRQPLRDAVAVQGLPHEDGEDHQIEGPLRDVELVRCVRVTLRHDRCSL